MNYKHFIFKILLFFFVVPSCSTSYQDTSGKTNSNTSETSISEKNNTSSNNEANNYLKYELIDDGKAYAVVDIKINGKFPDTINIPEKYNDLPITEIKETFHYALFFKTINISKNVTFIEEDVWGFFHCYEDKILTAINVDINNKTYSSIDGVLYNKEKTSLLSCPSGKEGKLIIPESVTDINKEAFRNSCLSEVTIPSNIHALDYEPFSNTSQLLQTINVSSNNDYLTSIDGVVYNKSVTDLILCPPKKTGLLEIANGVKQIDLTHANYSISSIFIPESVNDIVYSFSYCESLEEITVDSNNDYYSSVDGVLYNKDQTELICYPGKNISRNPIPNGITSIKTSAFLIGNNCTNLTIPKTVTNIEECAFWHCEKLQSINVNPENEYYSSFNGVLYNKDKTTLIFSPLAKTGNFIIPDSVITIERFAFYHSSIESIVIPDSVKYFGAFCFDSANNISSISLPNGQSFIGKPVFSYCKSLSVINYNGTIDEWIELDINVYSKWYNYKNAEITIHCTDGDYIVELKE